MYSEATPDLFTGYDDFVSRRKDVMYPPAAFIFTEDAAIVVHDLTKGVNNSAFNFPPDVLQRMTSLDTMLKAANGLKR